MKASLPYLSAISKFNQALIDWLNVHTETQKLRAARAIVKHDLSGSTTDAQFNELAERAQCATVNLVEALRQALAVAAQEPMAQPPFTPKGKLDQVKALELLEAAWGVIANVGGGNWLGQSEEWQNAAGRWRYSYHGVIPKVNEPTMPNLPKYQTQLDPRTTSDQPPGHRPCGISPNIKNVADLGPDKAAVSAYLKAHPEVVANILKGLGKDKPKPAPEGPPDEMAAFLESQGFTRLGRGVFMKDMGTLTAEDLAEAMEKLNPFPVDGHHRRKVADEVRDEALTRARLAGIQAFKDGRKREMDGVDFAGYPHEHELRVHWRGGWDFMKEQQLQAQVDGRVRRDPKPSAASQPCQPPKITTPEEHAWDVFAKGNDLLRTMCSIVERQGEDTNWPALKLQLEAVLNDQHAIMYGPGSAGRTDMFRGQPATDALGRIDAELSAGGKRVDDEEALDVLDALHRNLEGVGTLMTIARAAGTTLANCQARLDILFDAGAVTAPMQDDPAAPQRWFTTSWGTYLSNNRPAPKA